MEDITGIWIFKKGGELIFSHQNFVQGCEEYDNALFHGFIMGLEEFFKEFGESAEIMEMKNAKFFLSRNEEYKLFFVIKAKQKAKDKKVFKFLSKAQNEFINIYIELLTQYNNREFRIKICNFFKKYLENVLGKSLKDQFSKLLE